MAKKVVILGGGVAGMSAAHELAERGFAVEIFERQRIPGGKARSVPVYPGVRGDRQVFELSLERWFQANRATPGLQTKRDWLPGEHGFRFFPGFYRHVVDTMARIPFGRGSVADNLAITSSLLLARFDREGIVLPSRFPSHPHDIATLLDAILKVLAGEIGVPLDETGLFAGRVWQFMTSCHERRREEYEKTDWWDFIAAAEQSAAYQRFFGHGITRSLVAAKANQASTFTIGNTFVQLLLDLANPNVATTDRVLNGPTNLVWIEPWYEYLQARGVIYHYHTPVAAITSSGGRIESVTVIREGHPRTVKADYYLAALPIERIAPLMTPALTRADPGLEHLPVLARHVEWMSGIQFYLKRHVPLVHGHVIYVDSPWALTSVSQQQFWPQHDVGAFGDGSTRDILSIDISDWNTKGLNGKTVMECTRDEVAREVWAQVKRSVNVNGREVLKDSDWDDWFLDADINQSTEDRRVIINTEPLLVNHKDTLRLRPDAVTRIPNFFLASDYVRTHTDLATMEAANEAARRAVNGILDAAGSDARRCDVWPLKEPEVLEPFRTYDREFRWRRDLAYDTRLVSGPLWALEVLRNVSGLVPQRAGPFNPVGGTMAPGVVLPPFDVSTVLNAARSALSGHAEAPPAGSDSQRDQTGATPPAGSPSADTAPAAPRAPRRRNLRIVPK